MQPLLFPTLSDFVRCVDCHACLPQENCCADCSFVYHRTLCPEPSENTVELNALMNSVEYQLFPGSLYALATLEALSPTALNSAPVQALAVVISEIAPAAAAAISAAIMFSASSASEISRKSESPVVK